MKGTYCKTHFKEKNLNDFEREMKLKEIFKTREDKQSLHKRVEGSSKVLALTLRNKIAYGK